MGQPVTEFEAGNDCNTCIPELWVAGKTPKYMNVVFRGIEKCHPENPDPPNGSLFTVEQHPNVPCMWRGWWDINGNEFYVEINLNKYYYPDLYGSEILLDNRTLPSPANFYWWDENTCQIDNGSKKENMRFCAESGWYEGGVATVWWQPDDIPLTLTETYGFHPMADNLHDRLFLPDDKQCIKIANKIDKTNCLFSVDETQF